MNESGKPLFDMKYCVRCCMPETEEGYQDDSLGMCRICRSSEQKMHIDWAERWRALQKIMEDTKAEAGDNYDCLLPISGGKDSMFQLHVLCRVLGVKPLAVTFNHNWLSETGYYNLMNCLETFNVDHIQFTPNRDLVGRLARRSLKMIGDACWNCHSGVGAFPIHIAMKFNIPLIVYGESVAEVTQRGDYYSTVKECYGKDYYTQYSAKKTPDEMACDYISRKDLKMYQLPTDEEFEDAKVKIMHLGDYIFWDDERQMEFLRDTYGWRETELENAYKGYKSAECIMPGVHDFTCYMKRGWGRASFHASVDVRNGLLSREEGFDLVRKHDTQRPEVLDYYLQITGYTEDEFNEILKEHREPALKDVKIPITQREHPNRERLMPFPLQVLDKLSPKEPPIYADEGYAGDFHEEWAGRLPDGSLCDLSINRIHEGYRNCEFGPLDIAEAVIARTAALGDTVRAWVAFVPERLRDAARATEVDIKTGVPLRLLEGIPIGIKDIFNTSDYATEMGSPLWKGFTPGNDARVVFNLRRNGALIAGKTVTAEFAVHALNETLNPHDPTRTPGTSSSGSAAAVAVGLVPAAVATQTAASISRPASFCGVYGIKPSFGVIPRTGVLKTTDTLDTIGFFVRYLEDMERVFNSVRVHGGNYPFISKFLEDPAKQRIDPKGKWRVGFVKTHTWRHAEPYAKDAMEVWLAQLSTKANDLEIEEVYLPSDVEESHEVHETIYNKCLSYYFNEEFLSREKMSEIMASLIDKGISISPSQYRRALQSQSRMIAAMDEFMKDYDVLVSLSTSGIAPPRGEMELPDPGLIWTLAHLPTISAPAFATEEGMPFGLQLTGRKYRDIGLIRFAEELRLIEMLPKGARAIRGGGSR